MNLPRKESDPLVPSLPVNHQFALFIYC
jgi:hypothetical protein